VATALAVVGVVVAAAVLSGCASSQEASGDFQSVHRNTLTVATGEVPLPGLWDGTPAKPTGGFEFELAKLLAERFGLHHLKVVVVPFSQIVAGHLGGADMALSDITATPERGQNLDFSTAYLAATPAVLVRAGQSVPDLKTAQDLVWSVGSTSTLRDFLEHTIQPNTTTHLARTQHDTVEAIEQHRVDAGLLDLPVAAAVAADSHGQLEVAGQFDSNDDISAALPQGSPNVDATSSAIRALIADGTINKLAKRWLGLSLSGTTADDVPLIRTQD
jgi:ABC-type amino acid transport substrate-binding protein